MDRDLIIAACAEAEPVWFTTVSLRTGIQIYQPGQGNVSLREWTRKTGSEERLSRLSHGLWLDSLLAWQNSAVNDLLRASLAGEEYIRSVHLLMARADKPKQARCDGLWPLLTLEQSQLERLRPLLDAQLDERPEMQHDAELAQRHGGDVQFVGRSVGAEVKGGELNPALQNALNKFTLDVTANAREGKIDPVFGRNTEIR